MVHHIVFDGVSRSVFIRELTALYGGATPALAELPVQYADYAVWQRNALKGEAFGKQVARWKQALGEQPPSLRLLTITRDSRRVKRCAEQKRRGRCRLRCFIRLEQLARSETRRCS